jgi:RNA polymerase sigma-70 factor, ECF subfamily
MGPRLSEWSGTVRTCLPERNSHYRWQHRDAGRCLIAVESDRGIGLENSPGDAAKRMAEAAQALPWRQSENALVTELQSGSDAAFDWLVTHHHGGVYNLVYGMLADPADAADVTQDIFIKVFRGIGGFRRGSSLKTWLYRIAVREALNHRRWCWRHCRQQVSIDAEDANRPALEIEDGEATPLEQFSTREMQGMIREALASVSECFRHAVILRDLEDLSYEEVAEVLDISVGTVKSRILRGRRALRETLEPMLKGSARQASAERAPAAQAVRAPHSRAAAMPCAVSSVVRGGGR